MSFKNVHQPIQRTVLNFARTDYVNALLTAVIAASRINNAITARDFGTEDGKLRDLKINYLPPICDLEGDCTTNVCDTGRVIAPKQVFFQLKRCTASPVLTIRMADTRNLEGIGADAYSQNLIAHLLQGWREQLAKDLAALMAANMGCQLDGNPTKEVNILHPTTGAINPVGPATINKQFEDARLSGARPFVVGGSPLWYAQQPGMAGGTNMQGQPTGQIQFPNTFYDKLVNEQYGSGEHIWAFDPTVFKFIAFNFNAGRFATDMQNFQPERMFQEGPDWYSGALIDPLTGLLVDIDAIYDKCTKLWNFQIKLNWDLFFLPQRVCAIDCVNGLFHFTTCEMAPAECPPVVAPAPVVPQQFSFTPTAGQLNGFIGSITLGGQTNHPNVNVSNINELAAVLNDLSVGQFTVSGGNIVYTGYSAKTGNINGTSAITFAAAGGGGGGGQAPVEELPVGG